MVVVLKKLLMLEPKRTKTAMARRPDTVDRVHTTRAVKIGRGSCYMVEISS